MVRAAERSNEAGGESERERELCIRINGVNGVKEKEGDRNEFVFFALTQKKSFELNIYGPSDFL